MPVALERRPCNAEGRFPKSRRSTLPDGRYAIAIARRSSGMGSTRETPPAWRTLLMYQGDLVLKRPPACAQEKVTQRSRHVRMPTCGLLGAGCEGGASHRPPLMPQKAPRTAPPSSYLTNEVSLRCLCRMSSPIPALLICLPIAILRTGVCWSCLPHLRSEPLSDTCRMKSASCSQPPAGA